jgi:diketogulonate reductase-like aldo/keto reductase
VNAIAAEKGVSNAQIALAWLMAQGVVPIPGTRHRRRLEENAAATGIRLDASEVARLADALPDDEIVGGGRDFVEHARGVDR